MKINGSGSPMVGMQPGGPLGPGPGAAGGVDMGIVDKIMAGDKAAIDKLGGKREALAQEKNGYSAVTTALGDLATQLGGMSAPEKFQRLKVESSHPEVVGAELLESGKNLKPGQFNFEVKELAGSAKFLEQGFSDANESAVGFGYMAIERGGGQADLDVTLDPGSTLKDAADKINAAGGGVQASIINTGIGDEPFKLLVRSEKTGESANIKIDPDSTFLDFKELGKGKNLAMKFEDVDIAREENSFSDLIDGVKLTAKKAMPGTSVSLNISHDVDATSAGVKDFVTKYNNVYSAMSDQATAKDGERPSLGAASSMRQAMRSIQSEVSGGKVAPGAGGMSLAEVGIMTNAKTGKLEIDEEKLKKAITGNYDGVTKVFATTEDGPGLAEKLSNAVKGLQDRQSGVISLRQKTLDQQIQRQDQNIERQQRMVDQKQQRLQKSFADLSGKMQMMQSQGEQMAARMNG